jgi:hypothetical protein
VLGAAIVITRPRHQKPSYATACFLSNTISDLNHCITNDQLIMKEAMQDYNPFKI